MTKRLSKWVHRSEYDAIDAQRLALVQVLSDCVNGIEPAAVSTYRDADGDEYTFSLYRPTSAMGGHVLTSVLTANAGSRWVDVTALDTLIQLSERHPSAQYWAERAHSISIMVQARDRAFEQRRKDSDEARERARRRSA